jgi:putative oxidoreductase
MGAAFVLHGWSKIQNPLVWMGPDSPVPGELQTAAACCEFGGGGLLILGFLTRLAALGIGGVMVGALALVHIPHGDPFVAHGPSFELPAVYLASAILFLFAGAGRFSLDAILFGRTCTVPLSPAGGG